MATPGGGRPRPELVQRGLDAAADAGFDASCSEQTGRLLAALAALRPDGLVAESGTGYGVGTAWLAAGLGPHGRIVTVESDPVRAAAANELHAADQLVEVVRGDWRMLSERAPFDLFFCDGGGKRTDPDAVIAMVRPGGWLVLDDFTPSPGWPPRFAGTVDALRLHYLSHPELTAAEVLVGPEEVCILATRHVDP